MTMTKRITENTHCAVAPFSAPFLAPFTAPFIAPFTADMESTSRLENVEEQNDLHWDLPQHFEFIYA